MQTPRSLPGRWHSRCLAVGVVLWGVAALAQPAPTDGTSGATLSRTLVIPHDRELEVRLRSVQTALKNSDRVVAAQVLAELLSLSAPAVVQVGSVYRDCQFEAERILRQGPPELREAFRRDTEVRAAEEVRVARENGELAGLLAVAQRYPLTPAANGALLSLMEQFYDLGRFDAVVACGRRLIESQPDPVATARDYPLAIRLWRDALWELRLPLEAAALEERWPVNSQVTSPFRDVSPPRAGAPLGPLSEITWQVASALPEHAERLLDRVVGNLRRDGIQSGFYNRPLVIGDRILWRSLSELVCIHHPTGDVLWRRPLPSPLIDQIRSLGNRPDPARERRLARELGQRLQRDSVLGQLSADAERVYLVEPLESQLREDGISLRSACTLIACSLQTGEELWRTDQVWNRQLASVVPPPVVPAPAPAPEKQVEKPRNGDAPAKELVEDSGLPPLPYLFGPPQVTGGRLYVVGQTGESLQLIAIDPQTGESFGASSLGDCTDLMTDRRRLSQACPILWYNGQAICATGTGAIVAFDPFTARVKWAYRYGRDDQQVESTGLLQPSARRDGWQWLHGWQVARMLHAGDRIIAVSPESEDVHCLSARDGEPLWTTTIERGRHLVAVEGERVVLAGATFVRTLRLADGTDEAQLALSTPLASASWQGGHCVLTFETGDVLQWSPTTGRTEAITPRREVPLTCRPAGSLAPIHDLTGHSLFHTMPLRQSSDQLTVRPGLLERHLATEPAHSLASSHTEITLESPAESLRNQDLRELEKVARSADPLVVLPVLLRLLSQQPAQWEIDLVEVGEGVSRSSRTVRLDAFLRGHLKQLWDRSDAIHRSSMQAAVVLWIMTHQPSENELRVLEPLEFLSTRVLERPLSWTSLAELAQQHLALRRRHLLSSEEDAARALWRLGELHAARGDWRDAATIFAQLRDRLPHVVLRGDRTIQDLVRELPEDSPLARRMAGDLRTNWPPRIPRISTRDSYEGAELFAPLPMAAERGSLFDHVNIAAETIGGRTLRFSGLGRSRPWTITLPVSTRDLRRDLELRRAWGFGQFAVVQYGSELFCVSGLNVKGEASPGKSGILWPTEGLIDTLGTADNAMLAFELQPVPQPVGFTRPASERFDAHGHRSTWVGPVTPGITCYLEQGMLVCRETATGNELWRRYDLPDGVKAIGDDRMIVLQRDGTSQLELLSPLDGRTVRQLAWSHTPEECLKAWGRRVLVAAGQPLKGQLILPASDQPPHPPLRLEMVDLAGPTTLWSVEFPPGAAAFEVDEEWVGVVHPEGRILFLNALTGVVAADQPIPLPPGLAAVHAGVTERAVLVTLSSIVTEKALIEPFQTQHGWRRPAVNGVLASFDRQTGRLSWTRAIQNRIVPLDQPRDLPLIICADAWKGSLPAPELQLLVPPPPDPLPLPKPRNTPPPSEGESVQSRYFCLDARTGEILWEQAVKTSPPQYTVERDLHAEWIELRLGSQKTRFDYSSLSPAVVP